MLRFSIETKSTRKITEHKPHLVSVSLWPGNNVSPEPAATLPPSGYEEKWSQLCDPDQAKCCVRHRCDHYPACPVVLSFSLVLA